jgi:asparagine synthase (glutamine-hydrolysing)
MCGIAGIVGVDSEFQVSPTDVRQMCDCIIYRGPDEEGIWAEGNAGLGMRRLSIIDVSGGSQPIFNEDGSVLTVFNGEIYNFLELRTELEAAGHRFLTKSDTEVIVHLYEEVGPNLVNRLRGMFALAVYDKRRHSLLLARDRLGKKPLHYAVRQGILYFGSEIKSLLAVEPALAEVHDAALLQFFYYGYIPDPATAFKSIKKLPPGHLLEFDPNSLHIRRYWDVPQFASAALTEAECLDRMEEVLYRAVEMRLISDVPLGALLSGGVDSSLVVATMARASNAPVKTFSIGFGKADFDESRHARAVAQAFGTEHHELIVEPNIWETLEMLTGIMDEPFADSSIIPTYHVSRLARQFVTVALSGDGGDELFAGYDRYAIHLGRQWLDFLPRSVCDVYLRSVFPRLPQALRTRKLAYNIALKARDRYVDGISYIGTRDADLTPLSTDFISRFAGLSAASVMAKYFDEAPASDFLSQMQYADIKTYLPADILTKVDRMSMAASLETRAPLLDHKFVELAVTLPVEMKLQRKTPKYILRKLAERMGVPREVLYRRKQGFALPLVHWMRSEMRNEISALLLDSRTLQRGYLRRANVERILKEHEVGARDHSHVIWQLLVFELWHQNFLEQVGKRASDKLSARIAAGRPQHAERLETLH